MFTGIVREIGRIRKAEPAPRGGRRFEIESRLVRRGLKTGDSVSVGGVCLTVARLLPGGFRLEAVPETLRLTTLGKADRGDPVNLEPAARLNEVVGGHLVSGHVDGLGKVVQVFREGDGRRIVIHAPPAVTRYLVPKGSICVDGVSLTLAALGPAAPAPRPAEGGAGRRTAVRRSWFEIALIPHTLAVTTLGKAARGDAVNLEADLIAKHVAHLLRKRP